MVFPPVSRSRPFLAKASRRAVASAPLWVALVALTSLPALAQGLPPGGRLPGAAEPGRAPLPPPLEESRQPPTAKLQFSIPTQRRTETAKPGGELRFTLQKIVVEGAMIVGPDFYDPLITPLLARPVTLSEVAALADAIQARYVELGYVLSRAYVPAQEIADATMRIRVIEGHVDRLVVEGATKGEQERLAAITAPALASRPAHIGTLERSLLLASDLPGLDVSGLLRPGAGFGAAELVVTALPDPWGGSVGLGNRGSDFAGPWSAYADLYVNNLLDQQEQLGLTLSGTPTDDEQRAANLRWLQPLFANGLLLSTTGSYAKGKPGASLALFAVRTESWAVGQSLSYPLVRSRALNVAVEGGWKAQRSDVELLSTPFTRDDWRTADLRLSASHANLGGVAVQGAIGLVQGLDIFAASPRAGRATSRTDIDTAFTKFTADLAASARLAEGLGLTVSAAGQYTNDRLVSGEEFVLGGTRFGRGYDSGDLAGPRGVGASAELRYTRPINNPYLQSASLYGFTDWGRVWGSVALDADLTTIGAGLRLGLLRGISVNAELAAPQGGLDLPGLENPGSRFFFELSVPF